MPPRIDFMRLRTLPVFLAFLAMGFGDIGGSLASLAKSEFHLSNTAAALLPLVGFIPFGLLSVGAGVFQDKRGKKFVLMTGLLVALAGLLSGSYRLDSFPHLLVAMLLLGSGAAVLQVAGNPIMRDVSEEGKYSRNLSFGQFVKAIGSLSGPLIPVIARHFGVPWQVILPIYAAVLLITVLAVIPLKVPKQAPQHKAATLGSCLALLKNGYVLAMVGAIFFYVGAEVCLSTNIPTFLHDQFGIVVSGVGLLGTGLFFIALTIGRFGGGVALNWMAPRKFFVVTCAASILGLMGLFAPSGYVAAAGFFLAGLGFANIFPLVFSLVVESMPERANELSGLMVTAIVGGAVLPYAMGFVSDRSTVQLGFLVPLAAILYVSGIALTNLSREAKER
jgi:fucose permease